MGGKATQPRRSKGSPSKGTISEVATSSLPSWGLEDFVEMVHNPCVLMGFPRGTKSEVASSPVPSRGPNDGRNCYATSVFSGVPGKEDKIRSG